MDNISQHPKLILPKNCREVPYSWLKMEIFDLIGCPVKLDRFELYDDDNDPLCICQFIQNYEKDGNLNGYFSKPKSYIYSIKHFGSIKYLNPNSSNASNKLSIQSETDNIFIAQKHLAVGIEPTELNADTFDNVDTLSIGIVTTMKINHTYRTSGLAYFMTQPFFFWAS
jgi:hypothetical protein